MSYTELLALSRTQTKATDAVASSILASHQKKQEQQRKEQAVREKREKEYESRMLKRKLEEAQREAEANQRKEREMQARQEALARKEREERERLVHGPKKAASLRTKIATSGTSKSGEGGGGDDRDSPEHSGPVFTREELREQKRAAEMKRIFAGSNGNGSKRPSASASGSGHHRHRSQLRGGAVNLISNTPTVSSGDAAVSGKTARERIAAMPLTLTKLNTVKRDLRTIDEIVRDREKERMKIIAGDEAKEFNDWFSTKKKKEKEQQVQQKDIDASNSASGSRAPSRVATPAPVNSNPSTPTLKPAVAQRLEKSRSPAPASLARERQSSSQPDKGKEKKAAPLPTKSPPAVIKKVTTVNGTGSGASSFFARGLSQKPSGSSSPAPPATQRTVQRPLQSSSVPVAAKRPRPPSPSPSEEEDDHYRSHPPSPQRPSKRANYGSAPARKSYLPDDIYSLLTGGKKREQFSRHDELFSDDDSDMEAGAADLDEEEMYSARIAKREDEEALREQQRHEAEKKKRKMLKERRGH